MNKQELDCVEKAKFFLARYANLPFDECKDFTFPHLLTWVFKMPYSRPHIGDACAEMLAGAADHQAEQIREYQRREQIAVEALSRVANQKHINPDGSYNAAISYIAYIAKEALQQLGANNEGGKC